MEAKTKTKSSFASKINWTQGLTLLASVLVVFGIELPTDIQLAFVAVIQGAQSVVTWVMRTWFTKELIK